MLETSSCKKEEEGIDNWINERIKAKSSIQTLKSSNDENMNVIVIRNIEEENAMVNKMYKMVDEVFEFNAGPEFIMHPVLKNEIEAKYYNLENQIFEFHPGAKFAVDSAFSARKKYFECHADNVKEDEDNEFQNTFLSLGTRIANVGQVLDRVMKLTNREDHHKSTCINKYWKLLDYYDKGDHTKVYFHCEECFETISFNTHPDNENDISQNYAFVLGCMTAGIRYWNVKELRAAQGLSCMSAKTFRKYQDEIFLDSFGISNEVMSNSAKKEADIARKKGHVFKDMPYITVKVDASYAKRSKGKSYSSMGCCAVIIGNETEEVVDIVLRSKICAMCDREKKEDRDPNPHICI